MHSILENSVPISKHVDRLLESKHVPNPIDQIRLRPHTFYASSYVQSHLYHTFQFTTIFLQDDTALFCPPYHVHITFSKTKPGILTANIPPSPATINLCEIKQLRERTMGKATTCSQVEVHELPCGNVCPNCSVDIFKLEKRLQVVERYVSSPDCGLAGFVLGAWRRMGVIWRQ